MLALKAAIDILDRAGHKSPSQIDLHTTSEDGTKAELIVEIRAMLTQLESEES